MKREFERVSQGAFQFLHLFLVQMVSRTPHIHREIELGLVMNGSLTVREGHREWMLDRGDIYLINSMDAHEFASQDSNTLILAIQFSPNLLSAFLPDAARRRFQTDPPIRPFFSQNASEWRELQKKCVELALEYHARPEGYELRCFSLIGGILAMLDARIAFSAMEQKHYDAARKKMSRLIDMTDYIDQNFQRKLLLEEIAARHGLTLTYTSHLFRDALGVSFQDYLKEKRFEHALMLIEATDRTILEISLESGFSDERFLNALFRQRFGISPREYRKESAGGIGKVRASVSASNQRILQPEDALKALELFGSRQQEEI